MAGGRGTRMGGAEKPLALFRKRPLISYVVDALSGSRSIARIYVAISPCVPLTAEYAGGDPRLTPVMTPGSGFVEDMGYAIGALGLAGPVLVVAADLPLLTPEAIDAVVDAYRRCGKEALAVHVDAASAPWPPDLVSMDAGRPTVPAGINVVHAAHPGRAQEEHVLVVDDPALGANVNYRKDLTYCERLSARGKGLR